MRIDLDGNTISEQNISDKKRIPGNDLIHFEQDFNQGVPILDLK